MYNVYFGRYVARCDVGKLASNCDNSVLLCLSTLSPVLLVIFSLK